MPDQKTMMTREAAARIESATAKKGGDVGKASFPATAKSAAARNEAASLTAGNKQSGDGKQSGGSNKK